MSGSSTSTTASLASTIVNDVEVAAPIVSTLFPQLGVAVTILEAAAPIAEGLWDAFQNWVSTVTSNVRFAQAALDSAVSNAETLIAEAKAAPPSSPAS